MISFLYIKYLITIILTFDISQFWFSQSILCLSSDIILTNLAKYEKIDCSLICFFPYAYYDGRLCFYKAYYLF